MAITRRRPDLMNAGDDVLGSADVVAFVPTRNPKKARRFYEKVLGLEFRDEDSFASVFSANGVMLRVADVSSVRNFKPAPYTILGWRVDSVESAVAALRARGVRFQRFAGMGQNRAGIWTSPSGAKVAWFKDPDGNTLSITE